MQLSLYNSLTKKVEVFEPLTPPKVGLYTCGPTVYDYPTIGNWRTYITSDLLVRMLKSFEYNVTFIMNITDVGHLTGDNEGDADSGEDRLEKAAKKERKTAWDVAKYYSEDFVKGVEELNMIHPQQFTKATDHIQEQIKLVEQIEDKGYTYKTSDGIYFDVAKYESDANTYGRLSPLDKIKEGARVSKNQEKKDPRDFALWKFSPTEEKRDMEWKSPWGKGFPGWHIECSAMSMKYLGDQFDIHVGGEDLKSTHHPNEIAQAEAASGKIPFVKYWIHGAFLLVDGGRMGKSLGNAFTLHNIKQRGFDPMDLRYLYMTAHYRKTLNFTWEGLNSARDALHKLKTQIEKLKTTTPSFAKATEGKQNEKRSILSKEKLSKVNKLRSEFVSALSNDLNTPQALAVVWEVIKSNIPSGDKYDLIIGFDEVLGLKLPVSGHQLPDAKIPDDIQTLVDRRNKLRSEKKWDEADKVRFEIENKGFGTSDTAEGTNVTKKTDNR